MAMNVFILTSFLYEKKYHPITIPRNLRGERNLLVNNVCMPPQEGGANTVCAVDDPTHNIVDVTA